MNRSHKTMTGQGVARDHGRQGERQGFTARRALIGRKLRRAFLAAAFVVVGLVVMPAVANANVGFANVSGNYGNTLPNPIDFGTSPQGLLPKQITIWLYNDNSSIGGQTSSNVFTMTGGAYRRNGGSCNGTATGTSWTTTLNSGFFSRVSCSITLELIAGAGVGAQAGTISFTSTRTINNGGSRNLTATVQANDLSSDFRNAGNSATITDHDFGNVGLGGSATLTTILRNNGNVPMSTANNSSIIGANAAEFSRTTNCGATLAAGSNCSITVTYTPATAGAKSATLRVASGSFGNLDLPLSATASEPILDLAVNTNSFDYGEIPVGYPFQQSFTVSNPGEAGVNLAFALEPGTDPAVFYRNGGTCGATLAQNASCTVIMEFSPSAAGPAAQAGAFRVTGTSPYTAIPADEVVNLTGLRGIPNSSIEIRDTSGTTELTSHTISNAAIGVNTNYVFSIRNTGNVPIASMSTSLAGMNASDYSVTGNTCNVNVIAGAACQVTLTVNPKRANDRVATVTVTPAAAPTPAAPRSVDVTTTVSGLQIDNNDTVNMTGVTQKRWLTTPTLAPGGSLPGDIVRVAFQVDLSAARSIGNVQIGTSTTDNDTAPGGFQDIGDLAGAVINVEKKPGSTTALVQAEVPLSYTNLGTSNGPFGFSDGTNLFGLCVGGGDYKTDAKRLWFRVKDDQGAVTQPVGSIVRFQKQAYGCPDSQGPQFLSQRILQIDGVNQPSGTFNAAVNKNQPVTFQFSTRARGAPLLGGDPGFVESVHWRIRNQRTGAMFTRVGGSYAPCTAPCIADSNFTSGGNEVFASRDQGVQTLTIPGVPSRGRWVVEGVLQSSNGDEDDAHFYALGVLRINDHSGSSPTVSWGGSLGVHPDTDSDYTITANITDPADPVNALDSEGGRGQIIEWDLDGNLTNGPLGDGFEKRYETDSATNLPSSVITQPFSTTGKTPGPYKIRVRVTDNGSFLASENVAETKIFEYDLAINTPPEPVEDVINLEADQTQPTNIEFRATDVDNDAYRVDITPNGSNDGTLGGNLNDGIGQNTKPYTWPADYTGTDTFDFIPTDDHLGTGPSGVLTVKVRPNTTIDTSTIGGVLFHADESNPATRFLGSTTTTSADFDFSSPQHPIASYECRHLLDGNVLSDWTECSDQTTGSIQLTGLADGLHRLEVRAVNDDGDADGTPVFRTWRVDNTAPETEVFEAPHSNLPNQQPRFINDTTPTYKFHATAAERSLQQYMTYECRVMWGLNAGTWLPCGSPSDTQSSAAVDIVAGSNPDFGITGPLPEGNYEIQVRATDEVGNAGPTMVELFEVDTTAPETALASGPEGLVNTRNLEYVLGSSQGQSTFLCEVEGQNVGIVIPLGPCPGPNADGSRPTFTVPADDIYTLTAIAVDPANNQDPSPLVVNFEVDATEPGTTMDPQVDYGDGPTLARRTQSRKVDVTFTGSDIRQLQGFQCRLDSTDDADWELCSSPQRFSGLSDGDHVLEIRAKDEAQNFDSTPEVLEWTVDRTPPTTSFTVSPVPVSNNANPAFEFTTSEPVASSVCALDGGAPVPCTSPFTLSAFGGPFDEGMHQVSVKSIDLAGNVELAFETVSWRQDTVLPTVAFTSKPAHYVPLGAVEFGWDVTDGSPAVLAPEVNAECAIDPVDEDNITPGEWAACGRDLTIAEVDNTNGPHTLAVRAIDEAGNVSATQKYSWEVLGSKPVSPTIDDASPAEGTTTRVGTVYLALSHPLDGTGALEGLFCSRDHGAFVACDGNYAAEGLSDGDHSVEIVARDIAGNQSDPVVHSWSVQRGAPVTTINNGPSGLTSQTSANIQFSSDKPGTFECNVDGGAWAACTSPVNMPGLDEGQHSFSVRAISSVAPIGVKDPTPPVRSWTVDSIAPDVAINSSPTGSLVSYNGSVTFSSTDPEATFQCKLNSGLFDACASPWQLTGLVAGDQTVTVRAVDAAGNTSETPATASWIVVDPVCADGFEGTPPNCTAIPPVEGPGLVADSTGGTLSLAALGAVDLPADQVKLEGKIGSDGRWYVPAEGVTFAPVVQTIEDVLGPGSVVGVTINISARGAGWGLLTNGGGVAKFKLPVRADVEATLNGAPLFPPGTECALTPITFDLVGTWDAGAMTVHLEQSNVAFPTLTGCASFKGIIDNLLELPRSDIEMALDFRLTNAGTDTIKLSKPTVKAPKKIKYGKKAKVRVRVKNTGTAAATNVKVCLATPKKFIKGKAKRCSKLATVPAGKAVFKDFTITRKAARVTKTRKFTVKSTVTYKDEGGVARTVRGKATPKLLKYKGKSGKSGSAGK